MSRRREMQLLPRGKTIYVDEELDWGLYLLKLHHYLHAEKLRVYPSSYQRIEDLDRYYSLLAVFKDYDDAIDFKNKKLKNYEEWPNFEKYTFFEVKRIEKKEKSEKKLERKNEKN